MQKLTLSLLVAILSLLSHSIAWANLSEANFTPQGAGSYDRVPVSQVEVFAFKPDFKFKVIGVIEARGMYSGATLGDLLDLNKWTDNTPIGEKQDIALAMKALINEASRVGAHGVIILKSQQVRVSNDGSSARIIIAAAIRRGE